MATFIPNARQQFTDVNGAPLASGTVGMYVPSTLTPKNTYLDAAQVTLNPNPIPLDLGGFATIYGTGAYRQLVKDSLGNTIYDRIVSGSDAAGMNFTSTAVGAITRTVAARLGDNSSVKDFGATGNGATDDTTAITAADATAGVKFTPAGTYVTTLASTSLNGPYSGAGQIKDVAGQLRAPNFVAVKAAPTSFGNHNSIETAFTADISKVVEALEYRITGVSTLGQPTSGYLYTPEIYPHYTYLYNSSGWNNSTGGNTGRTAACAYRVKLYQVGQGDVAAFNFSGFVSGAKPGATSYLANPACVGLNGDLTAGQAGVYLNPDEVVCHDGGYDVACVGLVRNLDRTIATGALGAWWGAYRGQSIGTVPIDSGFSVSGAVNNLFDATPSALGTPKAAVVLKSGDRIYGNATTSNGLYATTLNTDWIERTANGWAIVMNGTTALLVHDGRITFNPTALPAFANDAAAATGGVGLGGLYRIGSAVQMRVA